MPAGTCEKRIYQMPTAASGIWLPGFRDGRLYPGSRHARGRQFILPNTAVQVLAHDRFLTEADVAPVEPDAVLGNLASPNFFHRFDPATGTHRVAFAPFHVKVAAVHFLVQTK